MVTREREPHNRGEIDAKLKKGVIIVLSIALCELIRRGANNPRITLQNTFFTRLHENHNKIYIEESLKTP